LVPAAAILCAGTPLQRLLSSGVDRLLRERFFHDRSEQVVEVFALGGVPELRADAEFVV